VLKDDNRFAFFVSSLGDLFREYIK